MTDMTRKEAAEALRVADQSLQDGAEAIGPRNKIPYLLVTGVLAVAFGACFDIPASLWGVGAILRFPLPMVIVLVWTLYTRNSWRARPRLSGYGRLMAGAFVALHLGYFAAAALLGIALRSADIPVPFTIAGVAYGLLMAATIGLAGRRVAARYADRIARDHR